MSDLFISSDRRHYGGDEAITKTPSYRGSILNHPGYHAFFRGGGRQADLERTVYELLPPTAIPKTSGESERDQALVLGALTAYNTETPEPGFLRPVDLLPLGGPMQGPIIVKGVEVRLQQNMDNPGLSNFTGYTPTRGLEIAGTCFSKGGREAYSCEDGLFVASKGGVTTVVVADGLGGHADGDIACRIALGAITQSNESGGLLDDMVSASKSALREFKNPSEGTYSDADVAASFVQVNERTGELTAQTFGDTRVFVVRKGGINSITMDDSDGNYITSTLAQPGRINRGLFQLQKGDIIIVGSDGYFGDTLDQWRTDDPEHTNGKAGGIANAVIDKSAKEALERLTDPNHRVKKDDATCVVMKYDPEIGSSSEEVILAGGEMAVLSTVDGKPWKEQGPDDTARYSTAIQQRGC